MAQLSPRTDLVGMDDYVLAELIRAQMVLAVQTPFIAMQVLGMDVIDGPSRTKAYPILSNIAAAAAVAETDEVGYTALASSEITITATLKSSATPVSDQVVGASALNVMEAAVNRVANACMQKIEADALALITSISGSQGSNAVVNDYENYQSVMAAVRSLMKSPAAVAYIAHPDQMRDLRQDAVGNSAGLFGSSWGAAQIGGLGGPQQGAKGFQIEPGVFAYETDGVPAGDTTGWAGAVVEIGAVPGLLMAYVPRRSVPGRVLMENGLLALDSDYLHKRFSEDVIASVDYGVAIHDQNRCYKFISRT